MGSPIPSPEQQWATLKTTAGGTLCRLRFNTYQCHRELFPVSSGKWLSLLARSGHWFLQEVFPTCFQRHLSRAGSSDSLFPVFMAQKEKHMLEAGTAQHKGICSRRFFTIKPRSASQKQQQKERESWKTRTDGVERWTWCDHCTRDLTPHRGICTRSSRLQLEHRLSRGSQSLTPSPSEQFSDGWRRKESSFSLRAQPMVGGPIPMCVYGQH